MSVDDQARTPLRWTALRRYRPEQLSCPGCHRCVRRRIHVAVDPTATGRHAAPDVEGTPTSGTVQDVARTGANGIVAFATLVLHALTLGLLQARVGRCPTCSHPAFQHGRRRRTRAAAERA